MTASNAWLEDAQGFARAEAARTGLASDTAVYGDHCQNCGKRWALPADEATCPHAPICEDCWPNGCPACEAKVEADLRRRDELVNAITQASYAMEQTALDLADSDLAALGFQARHDLGRAVTRGREALRQIGDRMNAKHPEAER